MGRKQRKNADIGFREILDADALLDLPESAADRKNRRAVTATMLLFVLAFGTYCLVIRNERSVTVSLGVGLLLLLYFFTDVATNNRHTAGTGFGIAAIPVVMLLTFDSTGGIVNLMWILLMPGCIAAVSGLKINGVSGLVLTIFLCCAFYTPLKRFLPGVYPSEVKDVYPLLFLFAHLSAFWSAYFRRKKTIRLNNRGEELEDAQQDLDLKADDMNRRIIRAIVVAVEAKDDLTRNHSVRVARYSAMLAEAMGWDESGIEEIYQGGMLHDIGKIGVDDAILKKKNSLTDEEYKKIRDHTHIGRSILEGMGWLPKAAICAELHHERYDGRGYPYGLKGEEIPIEARIIAVADSFDAMNADRLYRAHLTKDRIMKELETGAGTQFDPVLAEKFIPIAKKILENEDTE